MHQHSEAYLRAMKNQRQRKIRKKVLLAALVLGFGAGVFGFINVQGHQEVTYNQPIVTGGIATHFETIRDLPEWYIKTEDNDLDLSESDAYLLAKLAMAEAEGEDTIGKALVIRTVLNRVESDNAYFPDTVSEVIFQNGAFTPVHNGRFEKVEPNEDCYAALELVKEGWDESQGALYFERTTKAETWHSRNLEKLFVHGNHTFYMEVDA